MMATITEQGARELALEHRDLLYTGIGRRRLWAATLCETGQLATPGGCAPRRQVRRVQTFAPKQRAEIARLSALCGGLQDLELERGSETPAGPGR